MHKDAPLDRTPAPGPEYQEARQWRGSFDGSLWKILKRKAITSNSALVAGILPLSVRSLFDSLPLTLRIRINSSGSMEPDSCSALGENLGATWAQNPVLVAELDGRGVRGQLIRRDLVVFIDLLT